MITLPEVGTAILLIALVIAAACGRHFYRDELKPAEPIPDAALDRIAAAVKQAQDDRTVTKAMSTLDAEWWLHNGGMNA